MAGDISFSGLISGLNTKSIVEQLVALRKKQLVDPIQTKIDKIADRKSGLEAFKSAFDSLRTAALTLKNTDNTGWNIKSATSSDTATVLVASTSSASAIAGTYDMTAITTLAKADRVVFNGVANKSTTQLGAGTLTIKYGSNAASTITIASTASTLENVQTAINDADIGVTASIVNDGGATPYRLMLVGADTGSSFTVHGASTNYPEMSGAIASTLTVDTVTSDTAANQAANAAFTLNGLAISSTSNSVTDAVPGVTLTLLTTTASTKTITVKQDTTKILSNISAFVAEYNNVRTLLRKALLPDTVTGKLGALARETTLSAASGRISDIFSTRFNSLVGADYDSLAEVGITTDVNSNPVVDTGKLSTALDTNLSDVQQLFQGSSLEDGVAEKMYTYMDNLLKADGTFAKLDSEWTAATTQFKTILADRNRLIENYQSRLQNKFNKMEQKIAALKAKGDKVDALAKAFETSSN